jgi:hypothetical protein
MINLYNLFDKIDNNDIKVKTIYGYQINIGHNIFNEYTGLFILDCMKLVKYIDEVIYGDFDPFNIENYFLKNNIKISNELDINKYNNYIGRGVIFKYNHHFISHNCVDFIKNNLIKYNVNRIENDINKIKQHYPIINIVLRCGNRMLKNQDIIISDFINKIVYKYPNSYFYFDGFMKNKNNNCKLSFNNYDYDLLNNDYTTLVNSIINKINIKNYTSLINLYPYEIIKYLEIATIAIYNCGSGCITSGWLCNVPGIQYGVPHIKIYEEMDTYIKEDMCKLEYNDEITYNKYTNSEDFDFNINFDLSEKIDKLIK